MAATAPSLTTTSQRKPATDQFAAIDLGSNSFHMIVAAHRAGRLQIIDKLKEMVRLADGLNDKGRIAKPVMERALGCLERFGQRLGGVPGEQLRVVGTSTLRRAKNGTDFLIAAERALGHPIEVISGIEEARLIYLGVAHDLGAQRERRLVIDIGGGSTELIVGKGLEPELAHSLHMGCVNVTQRFFGDGKLTRRAFDAAIGFAQQELEPVLAQYLNAGWDRSVGASGTILAAAQIIEQLDESSGKLDAGFSAQGLAALVDKLIDVGKVDALKLPGLNQERAPVFAGGAAILAGLVQGLGVELMTTSQGALREGLLQDLLGRTSNHDTRDRSVTDLVSRFHIDRAQALRVRTLSQSLLAHVGDAWGLTAEADRRKLGWAADLHEIGLSIAHSSFHKHGAYLLANMDLPGFSQVEQRGLALLVRTHRRKFPKEEFQPDNPATRRLLRLAVLLRQACVMHRGRSGDVPQRLAATADERSLTLHIDREWLDGHPLTRLDFEQEAQYLSSVGFDLIIESH
ncbi:MAG: Ppx/GppA phosphatase family protein [Pseudomonadota bacterium]